MAGSSSSLTRAVDKQCVDKLPVLGVTLRRVAAFCFTRSPLSEFTRVLVNQRVHVFADVALDKLYDVQKDRR